MPDEKPRDLPGSPPSREIVGLRARIATLEQLLEVYERSVLEQSDRLLAEQETLRLQTRLLEFQGEASPDGTLSTSLDGRVLSANHRVAEIWGIEQPEVGVSETEPLLRAMAERTTAPHGALDWVPSLEPGDERSAEVELLDGRTLNVFTGPIRGENGEFNGRVWYFRDVTESRRVTKLKDEFISNVSHELRTPLTSIRGSLGLIAGGVVGDVAPEAKSLIEVAVSNCERLERLVNDILDIEKIEAGKLVFDLQPVALRPLLEEAIESNQGYRLGASILLDSGDPPDAVVRADPDRLIAVVTNLMSNAAKFSHAGEPIHVKLERREQRLRVSVIDRGVGIPLEFQPRVFEKFAQAEGADSRATSGTGLGLSIARAIVLRLGGTIGFESTPGEGSAFWFELPEWKA